MQHVIRTILTAGVLAAGVAAVTVPAQAVELRIAIGGTGNNGLVNGMKRFATEIEKATEGRYTGKVYEQVLLNYAETMTGVRDGVADIGYVIPAYARGEFPYGNLVVDLATAGVNPVAVAGAANEFIVKCEKCIDEYRRQNQVFLGTSVIGPYYALTKERITEPGDFAGKKIRGFGPFGRWVAAMGATPVVLGANDIYEAISQGQLDGNTHTVDTLRSLSLGEVVDYILDAPIGVYIGNNMFNMNRNLWNDLSDADKKAFIRVGGETVGWTTVTYWGENKALLADPKAAGAELVQPSEAVRKASEEFRANDLKTVAQLNKEKFGLADADEQLAILMGMVDKWAAMTDKVDVSSTDAVSKLFFDEIFSKVDPSKL
ncbi:MAG: C4-dicarboxylate TRAP transporter substrate-binding protein [Pseudomonadota bacterium]|nr:C4-dicarboxylate TRAP transporter substrate-binding protein [Pseudomonadota bacterium]